MILFKHFSNYPLHPHMTFCLNASFFQCDLWWKYYWNNLTDNRNRLKWTPLVLVEKTSCYCNDKMVINYSLSSHVWDNSTLFQTQKIGPILLCHFLITPPFYNNFTNLLVKITNFISTRSVHWNTSHSTTCAGKITVNLLVQKLQIK